MTTKLLALSLGVAMLSGIGIASADVVPGGLSKVTTQSNVVRLTDKQMDEIVASGKPATKGNIKSPKNTFTPGTILVPDGTFSPIVSEPTLR